MKTCNKTTISGHLNAKGGGSFTIKFNDTDGKRMAKHMIAGGAVADVLTGEFPINQLEPVKTRSSWVRNDAVTADCLLLAGVAVPLKAIRQWTDQEVKDIEHWAGARHLRASDHKVKMPKMPEALRKSLELPKIEEPVVCQK